MSIEQIPYIGEILSLSSAIFWALAVVLFKKTGETVHPIGLNSFKNSLAILLFLPTIWFLGQTVLNSTVSFNDYVIIYLSGGIGIGLADTFFFKCLNRLGASVTAIIDCFYSPFVLLFSFFWLDERLSIIQIIGAALIISAVITATYKNNSQVTNRKNMTIGVLYGILAMILMAAGVVLIKPVLDRLPIIWVTEHRLFGGLAVLLVMLIFNRSRREIIRSVVQVGNRKNMIMSSFIGAYLAMTLWLAGIKFTQASTAAALNQTTNIFIFIFAAWILKEAISQRKIFGIISAVAGALLVTFG